MDRARGTWDYAVHVRRLSDGLTRTLLVSGGMAVAECYADLLIDQLKQ